jgi:PAS domain S-box-containing protein
MSSMKRPLVRYIAAALMVGVAFFLRQALSRVAGELPPYITFYPAVMLAAMLGGLGPGLLATALAAFIAGLWILTPEGRFAIGNPADAVSLGLFCAMGAVVSFLAGMLRPSPEEGGPPASSRRGARKLATVFVGIAVVTIGSTFLVYWAGLRVTWANADIAHSTAIVAGLEETLSTLRDAETGQRGFLLTGEEKYLEPYYAALGRVNTNLSQLAHWAKTGDVDPGLAEATARLTKEKLAELDQTIKLRREKGPEAAIAVVRSAADNRIMDDIRSQIATMKAQELAEWNGNVQRRDKAIHFRTFLTAGMALVTLGFLLWAFRRIQLGVANTERAAAAVAQQKQLLAVTLASIGDGVIVTDTRGHVTFLNPEAEKLTGWKHAEAEGQPLTTVFKIVNESTRQPVESPVEKVLRLGAVVGLANHTVLIARDGRELPIDDSGAPIRQPDGTLYGVVLVFRDFSEQRKAQKALQESEALLRAMSEGIPDPLFIKDRESRMVLANPATLRVIGKPPEQVIGKRDSEFYDDPAASQAVMANDRRVMESGQAEAIEENVPTADGPRIFLSTKSPWRDAEGQVIGIIGNARDITERKQMEAALQESEERFRTMVDAITQLAWVAKPDGWIYWYNRRWHEYAGTTPEQMEGWGWQSVHDPQALPAVMERWTASIATGEPFEMVFPLRGADGVFRPFLTRGVPLKDEQGRVVQWFGTNTDISEQKRTEQDLAAAKTSAEQARAIAEDASKAKDHFLAVLSHELRTPLTPVLAMVSLLQEDPRFDAETRESLEMVRRNVEMEARLIDDLLDVTRIERGKVDLDRQPIELCTVLRRAAEVCMPDIEARRLEFGMDVSDGPYLIEADAARLQQVFWNLIKNAVKFTPHGGCVGVRCRRDGKNHVIAEVSDSGDGIESDVLPRLFNAFEQGVRSMKRQFGGLGLGLAISKGLVEMHGGTITAQSEGHGKGATFTVRLPLLAASTGAVSIRKTPPKTAAIAAQAPQTRKVLRILLVEDHGDTAHIMKRLLERGGHEVVHAADVATALQLADEAAFGLLISDLGLPDRSGLELMRELRTRGQTLPGIALSGYGQDQDLQHSREAGFAAHLVKPVNMQQLNETVASLMG